MVSWAKYAYNQGLATIGVYMDDGFIFYLNGNYWDELWDSIWQAKLDSNLDTIKMMCGA